VCLRAGLTWVRVRFISPFAVSALKHGCSEVLPTSQLIPTARVSAAWTAARDSLCACMRCRLVFCMHARGIILCSCSMQHAMEGEGMCVHVHVVSLCHAHVALSCVRVMKDLGRAGNVIV